MKAPLIQRRLLVHPRGYFRRPLFELLFKRASQIFYMSQQTFHILTIELSSYSLFRNRKHLSRKSLLDSFFFVIHIIIDLYFAEKTKRFTSEGQECLLNILIDIFFHIIIYFLYASIYISSSHRFFQHLQLSSPLSYLHQFLPTVNFDLRL